MLQVPSVFRDVRDLFANLRSECWSGVRPVLELGLPGRYSVPEVGHVLRGKAVFDEVLIVETLDVAHHACEHLLVEAGISIPGEVTESEKGYRPLVIAASTSRKS